MNIGNFAMELAEHRIEQERVAGVMRVQAAVRHQGAPICVDCDEEIDEARRRAAPFAERCLGCAVTHENATRLRRRG